MLSFCSAPKESDKVSNYFPMHQVIPGADVFHSFVTKLRYVPQAKWSGQTPENWEGSARTFL